MWDVLVRTPRGSLNPRKFSRALATLLVACFGYILMSSPVAHAADANWKGDNLVYSGHTYQPVANDNSFPEDVRTSPAIYRYIDQAATPDEVHFIYFGETVQNPKSEKEATYVRYTLNPPNDYTDESDKSTISLTPVEAGESADTSDGALSHQCTVDGIGWMVCPLMQGVSEGMDLVYNAIRSFLIVKPITTSIDNPIYRIWVYARDLANIAFAIGFLVIIYSYLVGGGFNGYEIRKILPRLVIAAILINVSYILCAVAVDASNIAGYGINQLFENVRDEILPGSVADAHVNWADVTGWVLGGGVGTVAGGIVLNSAIGGAAGGLWFLLAPFLLGGALLVMITFIILAARQAIIVILIAIAPLAFAAYILPNTEKWFDKWRQLFFTLLIMFPAFAAVFGGAELAGEVIIRTASTIEQIILGLGVMVAPLAVTPLLLKLGGGVLNRFAGIVNSPTKGIYDRYKNYNKERLEDFRAKQNYMNARRDTNGNLLLGRGQLMRRAAYRQNYKTYNRQRLREAYASGAQSWYDDNDNGIETAGGMVKRRYAQARGRDYDPSFKYGSAEIADIKHRSDAVHQLTEARHDQHWKDMLSPNSHHYDAELARQRMDTVNYQQGAKEAEASFDTMAGNARTYQAVLATDTPEVRQRKLDHNAVLMANGLTEDQVRTATETAQSIAVEGSALKRAEATLESQLAGIYKTEVKIRPGDVKSAIARAAGIDPNGQIKVEAAATNALTNAHMENVKAATSIFSNDGYQADELLKIVEEGKLRGGQKATDIHTHAAIQQLMLSKGNNWAAQKLVDYVTTQGMDYNEATQTYRDITGQTLDGDEVSRRRDLQQIWNDAARQSKLAIKYYSGSDRGKAEVGGLTYDPTKYKTYSEYAILRDIKSGKIDPQRLVDSDVDELQRMVQVLREEDNRNKLTDTEREVYVKTVHELIANPMLAERLRPRERGLMEVTAAYLDTRDDRPPIEKESEYIVRQEEPDEFGNHPPKRNPDGTPVKTPIPSMAPTNYDFHRLDDSVDGYGPQ